MDIELSGLTLLGFDLAKLIDAKTIEEPFTPARHDDHTDYRMAHDEGRVEVALSIQSEYVPEDIKIHLLQDAVKLSAIIEYSGKIEIENKTGITGLRVINGDVTIINREITEEVIKRELLHYIKIPAVFDYKLKAELTCVVDYFIDN